MENAATKRFYKEVSLEAVTDGFCVLLDGRIARTPGHNALEAPTKALADAVAKEWEAQDERLNHREMRLTALLAKAIDGGDAAASEGRQEILRYLETDALCYRADAPQKLVKRQAELWDPFLEWFHKDFGLDVVVTNGVMAVTQPAELIEAVAKVLLQATVFEIVAVANATKITGSAILAIVMGRGWVEPESVFRASRLDEHFQAEKWGVDEEAAERELLLQHDFYACAKFLRLLSGASN